MSGDGVHDRQRISVVFGVIAAIVLGLTLLALVVPVYHVGEDSGWFSCGSLLGEIGERTGTANGCDESGYFRGRASKALTLGVSGVAILAIAFPWRGRAGWRCVLQAACLLAILGVVTGGYVALRAEYDAQPRFVDPGVAPEPAPTLTPDD